MTSKPSQTGPLAKKKEKEENILLAEEKNRETKYWGGGVCISVIIGHRPGTKYLTK